MTNSQQQIPCTALTIESCIQRLSLFVFADNLATSHFVADETLLVNVSTEDTNLQDVTGHCFCQKGGFGYALVSPNSGVKALSLGIIKKMNDVRYVKPVAYSVTIEDNFAIGAIVQRPQILCPVQMAPRALSTWTIVLAAVGMGPRHTA